MSAIARPLNFEELWIPASSFADAPTPSFKLCLVLAGAADLSYRVEDRARRAPLRPGCFAPVSPPSVEVPLEISSAQRHLMIELDAAAFRQIAEESGAAADHLGSLHERPFRSPFLSQLCGQALREQKSGDTLGRAFVDSIQDLFVLTLLRMAHGAGRSATRGLKPLAPGLVEKVRSHCVDRMAESIAVAEMAAVAGLGTHQFSRAFKRATGQSPQQFLIALRVAHAADLLAGTALPLPEIALRCGFFDQAHLASTFSRQRGIPPSRYRREARG
jgi:AraC family transcriptional regulator